MSPLFNYCRIFNFGDLPEEIQKHLWDFVGQPTDTPPTHEWVIGEFDDFQESQEAIAIDKWLMENQGCANRETVFFRDVEKP